MFLRVTTLIAAIAALACADTLTLRSGQVVSGQYLGGDARHVKMAVGDRVENYSIDEVSTLQFGGGGGQSLSGGGDLSTTPLPAAPAQNQSASGLQVPIGSTITVRMIDGVDSEKVRLGQTFHASIDDPVVVDGQTVIPRGADAIAKLVEDKQSGKFAGRTVLTLSLMQVMVNGRMVDISTGDVSQASGSRGARTGKVMGGTTAAGAIIGAIAGGGKGAAIGAASGAAVGAGAQVMTKGQTVKIPSETRLTFTLQQPINL